MPARFTLQITPSFRRDLEALPPSVQTKVIEALRQLETNPFGTKVKKLKGEGIGQWRLEIWPYRVRYDVEGQEVVLYRVRHRKDIYRELENLQAGVPSYRIGTADTPGLDRGRASGISRIPRRTRGTREEAGSG